MKAPDMRAEKWMLRHGESIIERLLARSERTIGVPVSEPTVRREKDIYSLQYMMMRRLYVKRAMKGRHGER